MNKNIKKRLARFDITPSYRKKCLGIIKQALDAQDLSKDQLAYLAKRISFVGYVRNQKLMLTDKEVKRGRCALSIIPVDASTDLMKIRTVDNSSVADNYSPLATITVYQLADVDENPHLTMLEVLAQIPKQYVNSVSAFCLHLEDKFAINGYNLLTKTYEYQVELFAN